MVSRCIPVCCLMLFGCGQPAMLTFEAELVTVSGSPFGLTDEDRTAMVTGELSWHTGTLDVRDDPERGEYPHQGRGDFVARLPNGVEIAGSGSPTISIDPTTFTLRDGVDLLSDPQEMSVDGERDPQVGLFMALVHDDAVFGDRGQLPDALPDLDPDAWTHTFAISTQTSVALMQLRSLEGG